MITIRANDIKPVTEKFELYSDTDQVLAKIDDVEAACEAVKISERHYTQNNFIGMIHEAYSAHIPITLSPDDFWFYISYGFSRHINLNAEKYRKYFVNFEGKQDIIIERHGFIKGNKDNDWPGVFPEFSDRIADHVGKTRDLVVADYTTTSSLEKLAFEVNLMDAMQQYFNYRVLTKCGIPEINLLGTKGDWQDLKARANVLAEYDLSWWIDRLNPVLDNIIKSFDGIIDKSFWNSLYKHEDHGSGGPHITGWINELFPYVQDSKKNIIQSSTMVDHAYRGKKYGLSKDHSTSHYLSSVVQVPFIWDYYQTEIPMDFTVGHLGHTQLEDGSLKIVMGWGILNRPAVKVDKQKLEEERKEKEWKEYSAKMRKENEEREAKAKKLQDKLIEDYKKQEPKAANLTMNKGVIRRSFVPKEDE